MTDRAFNSSPIRDIAYALLQRSLGQRPGADRPVNDYRLMPMVDAVIDIEERFGIDLEADEIFRPGLTIGGLLDLVETRVRPQRRPSAQIFTLAAFRRAGPAAETPSALRDLT